MNATNWRWLGGMTVGLLLLTNGSPMSVGTDGTHRRFPSSGFAHLPANHFRCEWRCAPGEGIARGVPPLFRVFTLLSPTPRQAVQSGLVKTIFLPFW
jgi:hypothetical protein